METVPFVSLWNGFLEQIRESSSLANFKSSLKTYLFRVAFSVKEMIASSSLYLVQRLGMAPASNGTFLLSQQCDDFSDCTLCCTLTTCLIISYVFIEIALSRCTPCTYSVLPTVIEYSLCT